MKFYIYDKENEEFLSMSFSSFNGAESWLENCLGADYDRYDIYEKLT